MEGLYIKVEENDIVTERYKYVRPTFDRCTRVGRTLAESEDRTQPTGRRCGYLVMNWLQLRQSSLDDMLDWPGAQPWCRAMAECVQDAEWHSEGDVWTHTQMVCRQLENLDECRRWQRMNARSSS